MAEIRVMSKCDATDKQIMDIVHSDFFSDGSARLIFDCKEYGYNILAKIVQVEIWLYPHETKKIIDETKAKKLNQTNL
jgi:hypothetical protein